MLMIKSHEELTGYQITKTLYPNQELRTITNRANFIYKILENLVKRGILTKKNSYPRFYKIAPVMMKRKYELILYEVLCPKCKKSHWIMDGAVTRQCSCLKNNGKNRRFWITKQRYTGKRRII